MSTSCYSALAYVCHDATSQILKRLVAGTELHCKDGSCSVDGACSSGYGEVRLAVNTPPEIKLQSVFAADSDGIVHVPRGWLYQFCEVGNLGTEQEPCEPGAALLKATLGVQACAWDCLSSIPYLSA